jgi:hypothetical protein
MSQHSKQEQRARTLPSSSRAEEETTCGFGQRDIGSNGFFVVKISNGKKKENAHLRSRRGAEQDEPREQRKHRRSGSHGGSLEERLKGEKEEKRQRGRRKCGGGAAVHSSLSKPSLFLLPLLPLSFSSANLGDYLASSRYSTPAPWPKASNSPASEVVV